MLLKTLMLMLKKGMMKVLYRIKNKSGYLTLAGLYPGKSRNIHEITPEIKKLRELGLLSITEIKKTVKEQPIVTVEDNNRKKRLVNKWLESKYENYVSSNLTNVSLANNWMVLVFGVTNQGPTTPTLIQNYTTFTSTFGQPVAGVLTHAYVQFLLNSGVPVLFKRVIDADKLVTADAEVNGTASSPLFTIIASEDYKGDVGNNISVTIAQNEITNACTFNIEYNKTSVEIYNLGVATDTTTLGDLLYTFVSTAVGSTAFNSKYITLEINDTDATQWKMLLQKHKQYGLRVVLLLLII